MRLKTRRALQGNNAPLPGGQGHTKYPVSVSEATMLTRHKLSQPLLEIWRFARPLKTPSDPGVTHSLSHFVVYGRAVTPQLLILLLTHFC